jgi:6-phosphogluconate dehydrogenase
MEIKKEYEEDVVAIFRKALEKENLRPYLIEIFRKTLEDKDLNPDFKEVLEKILKILRKD